MTGIKDNDLVILRKIYQEYSVLHENQAFLCDLKRTFFSLSFMSAPFSVLTGLNAILCNISGNTLSNAVKMPLVFPGMCCVSFGVACIACSIIQTAIGKKLASVSAELSEKLRTAGISLEEFVFLEQEQHQPRKELEDK